MEAMQAELTRWERGLVRQVRTLHPEQLKSELEARRYRHRVCFEALVERAESLIGADPEMASQVTREAQLWVERHAPGEPEARICVLSLRGEALARCRRFSEARAAFEEAKAVEPKAWTPELGALSWRYALYLAEEGSAVTEAPAWADAAVQAFLDHASDPRVGSKDRWSPAAAWWARGRVGAAVGESASKSARCYLASALAANERRPRAVLRACQDLARTAALAWMSEDTGFHPWKVVRRLAALDRRLQEAGHGKHSPGRCRLRWVHALALSHLGRGLTPQSESYAEEVKRALRQRREWVDLLFLNLDLGYILLWEGRWAALSGIAREAGELAARACLGAAAEGCVAEWQATISRREVDPAAWQALYREVRGLGGKLVLPGRSEPSPGEVAGW